MGRAARAALKYQRCGRRRVVRLPLRRRSRQSRIDGSHARPPRRAAVGNSCPEGVMVRADETLLAAARRAVQTKPPTMTLRE